MPRAEIQTKTRPAQEGRESEEIPENCLYTGPAVLPKQTGWTHNNATSHSTPPQHTFLGNYFPLSFRILLNLCSQRPPQHGQKLTRELKPLSLNLSKQTSLHLLIGEGGN